MLGINGLYLDTPFINKILKDPLDTTVWFVCLFIIIWGMPNSQQIMARYRPSVKSLKEPLRRFQWRPTWQWALLTIVLAALSLNEMEKISEFLYFQF
jgi:hypothetical protein